MSLLVDTSVWSLAPTRRDTPPANPHVKSLLDAFESGVISRSLESLDLVDWRLLRYFQARDVVYDLPEGSRLVEAAEDAAPAPTSPSKGLTLWQEYQRDQIEPYFGSVFNTGARNAGIVVLTGVRAMILLVTMDKGSTSVGGRAVPFRYAGSVRFAGWEGDAPMMVQWDMADPVPRHLRERYGVASRQSSRGADSVASAKEQRTQGLSGRPIVIVNC